MPSSSPRAPLAPANPRGPAEGESPVPGAGLGLAPAVGGAPAKEEALRRPAGAARQPQRPRKRRRRVQSSSRGTFLRRRERHRHRALRLPLLAGTAMSTPRGGAPQAQPRRPHPPAPAQGARVRPAQALPRLKARPEDMTEFHLDAHAVESGPGGAGAPAGGSLGDTHDLDAEKFLSVPAAKSPMPEVPVPPSLRSEGDGSGSGGDRAE